MAALVVMVLPVAHASGAFDAKLKRYPYLTDLTTTSVGVNFGTDISATSAVVKYGPAGGSCTTSTATGARTFILVNGVSEYQWKAQLTGLAADTQYCYRVYFGNAQLDLLGTDPSPVFRTQIASGSAAPFKFAVFGDWGKTLAAGNPDQANVISQMAASGARFAVTTGDNAYEVGSQKDYGDLYQTGDNTSAVFGPSYWKVAGASLPLFPAIGNHDHNNSTLLTNWPQDAVVATSGGRYQTDTYCCQNGTASADYPSAWYAFDAGLARFYVLTTAWDDSNAGTATSFQNDFDNHWGPGSAQYQWLANDLATHPRAVRFAFWHYPFDSDSSEGGPDTFLQGANSLEGLLNSYDVTAGFSGHSHNYQRNTAPPGGIPTHITGGGGANLESIGATNGCSAIDAYGIGWSSTSSVGSACGAGPVPAAKDRVHHFLLVSVSGTSVTVTPTDELGRTFDPITYDAAAQDADLSLTKSDSPDPVLVGQPVTYTLTVDNLGPRDATGVQVTDTLPPGMIFDSATPSQGSCSQASGTVTCQVGTVADGASASITIEGRPQSTGTISNTATVSSNLNDPVSSNNTATAATTVNPSADLAVTNTDSPDPVTAGQQLTYTVGVANAGPSSATGITLIDTLPAGVTFNSATPSQGTCSRSGSTVTCSLGTLAPSANASISIKVTPGSAGSITNQANVTSLTGDPNTTNNGAAAATTVVSPANLSLTITDTPDPVLAGALLTYNLTVGNSGPGAPTATNLTDTLPASMVFDSAMPSQGTCSYMSGTVTCELGTLANGANATVQIKVRPQTTGHHIPNSASVASELSDPSPGNNTASTTTDVDPGADLSLTKTDSPDPVGVGQQLTYTLAVSNAGPSIADDIKVTDTLPAGVTYNSATPSQGTCSQKNGKVTCSLGDLANGASASATITVTPQSTGVITNTATVDARAGDPFLANNSASATTSVRPLANLSLTKSDSPDPVRAGQPLTYNLGVANAGPSSATGVTVTDTLPAGVTFDSATPSQGICSEASGTVTCALGTIANGQGAGVEISVTPQIAGEITNQASVASDEVDLVPADNSAGASTTVDPAADLSIVKSDSPDPVSAGQLLTYTLSIANAGPTAAAEVTVTDTLPAGVTYDSATPSQGSCSQSAGVVTCALDSVGSGATASVDIEVTSSEGGTIMNQAAVTSTTWDPVLVNNAAGASTTVAPVADLSLTKTDSPDPALVGELLTYGISVSNAGPSSATGVTITDTLPAGVTFDTATPSQGTCSEAAGTVTCALGTIAAQAGGTVEIGVRPSQPGTIANQAEVTSGVDDPDSANNAAGAETTVDPVADLSLTKTDSPDPVLAGQPLTYNLDVANAGPSSATGVTVTDTLPAGVRFDSATPSQGTCSEASGTVTCALGTIASGQGAGVEISVTPETEGEVTNQASVSSDTADLVPGNDSDATTTTVDPAADLSLTKSGSPDPALSGQLVTYSLGVANAGPSGATGVAVTDTLPAGVTFESATPSQGTCAEDSGTVTCALGTIADGDGATVEIKVRSSGPGTITNEAMVSATTADPVPVNNVAGAETVVDPAADLSLTNTDAPDPVLAGDLVTYTLTAHNAGPDDATAVELTDTLPAGVTYDSATPSQGSCSHSGTTVTCALGTIAQGASASVEIKVAPVSGGTITNQAEVTSAVRDPDSADNSASAETTVDPAADMSLTISDSPDPVFAGQLLTYTLTAHNGGPDEATEVELTDTLTTGVNFDSATPSQGSCSHSSGTVTCTLGAIAADSEATVVIKVKPSAGGTITNQATVSAATADPVLVNNGASEWTTVDPVADLSLTSTDSPDPVLSGDPIVYTLTAENAGPDDATGVELTDTLPAGVTFDSAMPSQGTCSEASGAVTCALGTIADGQGAEVVISVTPGDAGDITNEAIIGSEVEDPNLEDNHTSAVTTVQPVADLELTKSDSPDPVAAGRLLTYTLTVHNAGPQDATAVELTDDLPAGVTFDSATASQASCSQSGGTVTCALGTIGDGQDATVEIKVRPAQPGTISNQAQVTSDIHDPGPADNAASAETTVDPAADLSLTKSASPDPVLAGELLAFTLTAHNAGPQDATGVELTDDLPAGATFDSATPSQGTCSESSGTVTCALGTIADQAGAAVEINVRPSAAGTISNEASLLSSTGDPDPANNAASAGTTVTANPVGYARPKGATPVSTSLVLAYTECTAPNRTHGPPLDSAACNPPQQRSSFLTIGSPDANGKVANMAGTVRFSAVVGDPGTPADEADLSITFQATDIRNRTGLTDYTGELQGRVWLRITDRLNGATGRDSATTTDVPYTFTVPCAGTGGTADIGATCSLNTTADAITPGTVPEAKRTIWEMQDVTVLDGGADGDAQTTAGNTLFLRQGVFVP